MSGVLTFPTNKWLIVNGDDILGSKTFIWPGGLGLVVSVLLPEAAVAIMMCACFCLCRSRLYCIFSADKSVLVRSMHVVCMLVLFLESD